MPLMCPACNVTLPPIPMLLTCPACGERHVDAGAFATKPHHTHACQSCGMTWRPAVEPTVGVQFLPGFKDAAAEPKAPEKALRHEASVGAETTRCGLSLQTVPLTWTVGSISSTNCPDCLQTRGPSVPKAQTNSRLLNELARLEASGLSWAATQFKKLLPSLPPPEQETLRAVAEHLTSLWRPNRNK